jgi:hypothetical protein
MRCATLSALVFATLLYLGVNLFSAISIFGLGMVERDFGGPGGNMFVSMVLSLEIVIPAGAGHLVAAIAMTRLRQPLTVQGAALSGATSFLVISPLVGVFILGSSYLKLPDSLLARILAICLVAAASSVPGLLFATRAKLEHGDDH